jgi:hypothetical protein
LKGIPELKKQFEEREITLTDITAKEIGIKTGLDEEKIKKILEYHDLSDNEANEDYADLVVVKVKYNFSKVYGGRPDIAEKPTQFYDF